MKSILENRPALAAEVDKVAEVAGYLSVSYTHLTLPTIVHV